jgi:hypothetical protein
MVDTIESSKRQGKTQRRREEEKGNYKQILVAQGRHTCMRIRYSV